MTILGLLQRVEKLNTERVTEDSLEDVMPELTKRQKEQLLEGKNQDGEKIGRYRNSRYAQMKNQMNAKPGFGVPDLRLTGAFYKSIYAEVRGNRYIVDATDSKTQDLVDKYGEQIFGLNPEAKKEFIEKDLRPVFMGKIRKELGL